MATKNNKSCPKLLLICPGKDIFRKKSMPTSRSTFDLLVFCLVSNVLHYSMNRTRKSDIGAMQVVRSDLTPQEEDPFPQDSQDLRWVRPQFCDQPTLDLFYYVQILGI